MSRISVDGIALPTQEELDEAAAAFDDDWGEVDKVLYAVCAVHPRHDERRHVVAKVALVGRACNAGVERCVTPGPGQQAVMLVGEWMWTNGGEVDAILTALTQVNEPLTARDMREIVEQHGRLARLIAEMPECKRVPRSFAAKYLHFHHSAVPIYDSYAAEALGRRVKWSGNLVPFTCPPNGDEAYWEFCVRLFRLYDACWKHGLAVTTKLLDTSLWTIPA